MIPVTTDSLIETFSHFADWQNRYRYLISLGNSLPPFPIDAKKPEHLVAGCESKVWLLHQYDAGKHYFLLDSEAKILRGLLMTLWLALDGRTTEVIMQFDLNAYLSALYLSKYLSASRMNGLQKIFQAVQRTISELG